MGLKTCEWIEPLINTSMSHSETKFQSEPTESNSGNKKFVDKTKDVITFGEINYVRKNAAWIPKTKENQNRKVGNLFK